MSCFPFLKDTSKGGGMTTLEKSEELSSFCILISSFFRQCVLGGGEIRILTWFFLMGEYPMTLTVCRVCLFSLFFLLSYSLGMFQPLLKYTSHGVVWSKSRLVETSQFLI